MNLTWINGTYVDDSEACLHVSDLAIQRGYGVFEFFSVCRPRPFHLLDALRDGEPHQPAPPKPFLLSSYLDRFYQSASGLNLKVPLKKEELAAIIHEFIVKNQLNGHGIKMILTGGYSDDGYTPIKPNLIIRAHQLKRPAMEKYLSGFRVMTNEYQRSTPGYKSLDYRHAISLIPILKEKGLDDVLYQYKGVITEFPRSNFFMVDQHNRIITPSNNILEGITRKALLHVARDHYEVQERDILVDELLIAREAFLTSTTKLIMPITEIDGSPVGEGVPGPVTRQLAELLDQLPEDLSFN